MGKQTVQTPYWAFHLGLHCWPNYLLNEMAQNMPTYPAIKELKYPGIIGRL